MQKLSLHYRSFTSSLLQIIRHPIEHLLNILVISMIIAILCSIIIINKTSTVWETNNINYPQIVIYLDENANQADVSAIESTLNHYNTKLIKNYQFISKEAGLNELTNDAQLKQIASDVITDNVNPLPDVLIVNTMSVNMTDLNQLTSKISDLPMVSSVQIDSNYANKISDLINIIKKFGGFLQGLFVIVLILVIYNMVRLQMLTRKDEITVSRLIGASDSFIMRPLIYYGISQTILGTIIAYLMTNAFVKFINQLLQNSSNLFGNSFVVANLDTNQLLLLIASLIIFTILSVFLAVQWVFRKSIVQYF